KTYLFTVRWGEERDTDDAEGRVVAESESRPDAAAIRAELPRFTGTIEQVPPRFSAIKIDGERPYDPAPAMFEAEWGKGTYVRSLAGDLGRLLGVFGHVSSLRRSRVGSFGEMA